MATRNLIRTFFIRQPLNPMPYKQSFGLTPFRSPLLRGSIFLFFLGANKMFQFTPCSFRLNMNS